MIQSNFITMDTGWQGLAVKFYTKYVLNFHSVPYIRGSGAGLACKTGGKLVQSEQTGENGGETMNESLFPVGVLLIVLGLPFLLIPLEHLQKVFRRMRSRTGTKVGGALLIAAGVVMMFLR